MKKSSFLKVMMLVGILPLSTFVSGNNDNVTTSGEDQLIELANENDNLANENTLQVPVTATLSNNVLNVQFTGSVPMATVTVSNAMTGATISQQSLPATAGTVTSVPVSGLSMGTVTVTNQISGQSVSGEFVVANGQE